MLLERFTELISERESRERESRRRAWQTVRDCLYSDWAGRDVSDERFAIFIESTEKLALATQELADAGSLVAEAGRIQAAAIADRQNAATGDCWIGADLRFNAIARQNPPLFDGESCETSITLDMRIFGDLQQRLRLAIDKLPRRLEPSHCDDCRSSLAQLGWQVCCGESPSFEDVATAAKLLAGANFSNYDFNLSVIAFAHLLQQASDRDEFDSSDWFESIRPSIAAVRLEQLRRERPMLLACDCLAVG